MLNWKIRYSKILQENPGLFDKKFTVIEIGSGAFGIAQFLKRPVTGVEPNPVQPQSEYLKVIQGTITNIPFQDEEIDFVVCADVLEHIPPHLRAAAIAELIRVCRQKVIISCPCHIWARLGETELARAFETYHIGLPNWLLEHLNLGVPLINEILDPIANTKHSFELVGNETLLQHYSGILMDTTFPWARILHSIINEKSPVTAPIFGDEWDLFYSFMFSIHKHRDRAGGPPAQDDRLNGRRAQALPPSDIEEPRIYSVYHKDFPTAHLGRIVPIFAGKIAHTAATGQLTDKLLDGASLTNERWSVLSAIYKIWKEGPKSPIVGFSHYRRLFDFRPSAPEAGIPANRHTIVEIENASLFRDFFFDEKTIRECSDNVLFIAPPSNVQTTIFEQYCMFHNTNDYLYALNQLSLSGSPVLTGFLEQFSSNMLYANNMFITTWELFSELCDLWFPILQTFSKDFPDRRATDYQKRDVAFLSERIFDAWVRYRKSCGTKVIELPIFVIA